ncbi:FecCD family ABC transporter permease [Sutcliffiella horikoshii]|uniref:FecCD family ABC transporter permease n=1 Tax=Sutcliffiella horikoshii TaxID=79883 RepID=UPI001F1C97D6|nr:iron ABC transporter permease [Sutcliffiella horikoshii]MCG1021700.1 iron ABC transporter permease [Sutcliffiella horikoshii]
MLLRKNSHKILGLIMGVILLFFSFVASIIYGYTNTSLTLAIDAFRNFDGSNEHIIIQSVRLPRAIIAAIVGGSLAIAGLWMQALTKNPLASPGIFGINAGASFFVVVAVSFFSVTSLQTYTWLAFAGAALAAFAVYFIGSIGREGLTPMKLTLAGAAFAAMFSSLTQGLLVVNETALDQVLFWLAGSVQGRSLQMVYAVLPYIAVAWIASFFIGKKINLLAMGDDVATSLGVKTGFVKLTAAVIIILLAGGSVAIAGPIVFIGIVIPHVARYFVGNDHRWLAPYCGILGGILLLTADIGARYVIMPQEVPVGVMTAIIGTPFFIYIARRGFHGK